MPAQEFEMQKESFGQTMKDKEDEEPVDNIHEDISDDMFGIDDRDEDEIDVSTGTFKQKADLDKLIKIPSQRILSAREKDKLKPPSKSGSRFTKDMSIPTRSGMDTTSGVDSFDRDSSIREKSELSKIHQ